jgi:hypothetical protein
MTISYAVSGVIDSVVPDQAILSANASLPRHNPQHCYLQITYLDIHSVRIMGR